MCDDELFTRNDESVWRSRIGMSSKDDSRTPKERGVYLRRLNRIVESRLLSFIRGEDNDPDGRAMRTQYWTPFPWLCQRLEISFTHLSRLLREVTGLSAVQTYDKVKLLETRVLLNYIALIREFVASCPPPVENASKHFWIWLKQQRHNPNFDRQALAREFNFPSAVRLHRALNIVTALTPREFENEIIQQALEAPQQLEETIARYTPQPETTGFENVRDIRKEVFARIAAEEAEENEAAAARASKEQLTRTEPAPDIHQFFALVAPFFASLRLKRRARSARAPPLH